MTDVWVRRGNILDAYGRAPLTVDSARDSLVLGAYRPDASTAGIVTTGQTVVTSASQLPGGGLIGGTTYVDLDFRFQVIPPVNVADIVFRNCIFRGNVAAPTTTNALIRTHVANHARVIVWDSLFEPQTPNAFWVGLLGFNFEARRCEFRKLVDNVDPLSTIAGQQNANLNALLYQSWIHDLAWWPWPTPGTTNPDGSHNDGVQYQGGGNFDCQGNHFSQFNHPDYFNTFNGTNHANPALLCVPDTGLIQGLKWNKNWIYGGSFGVFFGHDNPDRYLGRIALGEPSVGEVHNNVFGRGTFRTGIPIYEPGPSPINIDKGSVGAGTANIWDDTGTEVAWAFAPND